MCMLLRLSIFFAKSFENVTQLTLLLAAITALRAMHLLLQHLQFIIGELPVGFARDLN